MPRIRSNDVPNESGSYRNSHRTPWPSTYQDRWTDPTSFRKPDNQRFGSADLLAQYLPTSAWGRIKNFSSDIPRTTASATSSGVIASPEAATTRADSRPSARVSESPPALRHCGHSPVGLRSAVHVDDVGPHNYNRSDARGLGQRGPDGPTPTRRHTTVALIVLIGSVALGATQV